MALYQTHRPQNFNDLVGQTDQAETLKEQISQGKFSHAYLFTGPKGIGKTTTARLVAKALNCENPKDGEPCNKCISCKSITSGSHLDVIEIDAASNRGIEDMRDLREKIKLSPSLGKYKVYIIDEVHMLTTEAFNALLKTLEEPPSHAVFILCTTEAHKVPATILSRCQKFSFDRATDAELTELLKKVAKKEGLSLDKESLEKIAASSDGSYRDSLTILEQLSIGVITSEKIEKATKRGSQASKLLQLIEEENAISSIELVNQQHQVGISLSFLTADLLNLMRLQLLKAIQEKNDVRQLKLLNLLRIFSKAYLDLKNPVLPSLPLELAIVEGVGTKERIVRAVTEELVQEETQEKPVEVVVMAEVTSPSLDLLKASWERVLKNIKPFNHSLEAFLRGCEPNEVTDKSVTLKFFYKFHKDMVDQPKNRELVEREIGKVLERELHLKTILGDKSQAKRVKIEEIKNVEEVTGDDLIQKAVDIFNTGIN